MIGDARRSPRVLRSEGCTDASWIEVEAPPGSRVRVDAGDRSWVALVTHESGFASAGPTIAHIGLGDADIVDRIVVSPWWGSPVAIEGQIDARRRVTWRP